MRVVTVAGDPEREAHLAAELERRADVDLVLRCVDRVEALGCLRGASLDALVVVGDPPWFDVQCGEEAGITGTRLVALAPDPLAAERMRELGATVVAYDMDVEALVSICAAPAAPIVSRPAALPAARGSIAAVWGAKGAPGRSTVAIELAAELSVNEPDTLLVDADTYGGDLLQMLGIVDEIPTIVWAGRLAAKRELNGRVLTEHLKRSAATGPQLLAGIPRSDLWPEISDRGWKALLDVARATFRYVICDVGSPLDVDGSPYPGSDEGRNRVTRSTLRMADHVIAVVRGDPVGIKNFLWGLEHLKEIVDTDNVHVVANRVRPGEEREVSDLLKRYIRKRPVASIPEDPSRFSEAIANGIPVRMARPHSPVASAVANLASAIGAGSRPRGFLARLGGRA